MKVTKRLRLEDLGVELRLLPQKIREATMLALQIPWMLDAAQSFCPVDTGALLGSVRWEIRGPLEAALIAGGLGYINPRTGLPVTYAKYVHDGTNRMPARPFLLQAVIQERLRYAREMLRRTAEAF
jgi:HK97 gp10 family phage protein